MTRHAPDHNEIPLREILQAAAAQPAEVPEPLPALATIAATRARAAATRSAAFDAVARRMLAATATVAIVFTAWVGLESATLSRAREEAVTRLAGSPADAAGLMLLAATEETGGRR